MGEWLCRHIFSGPGATLAFCDNGFFALRLENSKKEVQHISGLWRLNPDSIGLSLLTLQDGQLNLSAGQDALHAILPNLGPTTLFPAPLKPAVFHITGLLEKRDGELWLEDASSGMVFPVPPTAAEPGKFSIAELEISEKGAAVTRILSHSRPVPRYYRHTPPTTGPEVFEEKIQQNYWLLPPYPGLQTAALRFGAANAQSRGSFEISGPGLRLDGTYTLNGNKLTLAASSDNVKRLELIGLKDISDTFLAAHTWQLSSRGLELESPGKKILLLPFQPG